MQNSIYPHTIIIICDLSRLLNANSVYRAAKYSWIKLNVTKKTRGFKLPKWWEELLLYLTWKTTVGIIRLHLHQKNYNIHPNATLSRVVLYLPDKQQDINQTTCQCPSNSKTPGPQIKKRKQNLKDVTPQKTLQNKRPKKAVWEVSTLKWICK